MCINMCSPPRLSAIPHEHQLALFWSELLEACFNHNHEEAAHWLALAGPSLLKVSYHTCCRAKGKSEVAQAYGGKLGTAFANLAWAVDFVSCCLPGSRLLAPASLPEAYKPLQAWLEQNPLQLKAYSPVFGFPLSTLHSWSCLLGIVGELYERCKGVSPCCSVHVPAVHKEVRWGKGKAIAVPVDLQHPRVAAWMKAILANLMRFYAEEPGEQLLSQVLLILGRTQQQHQQQGQVQEKKKEKTKPQQQQQQTPRQSHDQRIGRQAEHTIPNTTSSSSHLGDMSSTSVRLPGSRSVATESSAVDTSEVSHSSSSGINSSSNSSRSRSSISSSHGAQDQPVEATGGSLNLAGTKQLGDGSAALVCSAPRVCCLFTRKVEPMTATQRRDDENPTENVDPWPVPGALAYKLLLELLLLTWPPAAVAIDGHASRQGSSSKGANASMCVQDGTGVHCVSGLDVGTVSDPAGASIQSSHGSSNSGIEEKCIQSVGPCLGPKELFASGSSSSGATDVHTSSSSSNVDISSRGSSICRQLSSSGAGDISVATFSSSSSVGMAPKDDNAERRGSCNARVGSTMGGSSGSPEVCMEAVGGLLPAGQQRWEWLLLLVVLLGGVYSRIHAKHYKQWLLFPPKGPQLLQLLYHVLLQDVKAEAAGTESGGLGSDVFVSDQDTKALVAGASLSGSSSMIPVATAARVASLREKPDSLQKLSVPDLVMLVLQSLLYVGPEGLDKDTCSKAEQGKLLLSGTGERDTKKKIVEKRTGKTRCVRS